MPFRMIISLLLFGVSCSSVYALQFPCDSSHCNGCQAANCISCDDGYYVDNVAAKCADCSLKIGNCAKCVIDADQVVTCNACSGDYLPTNDAKQCRVCQQQIPHCAECIKRLNKFDAIQCDVCEDNWQVGEGRVLCQKVDSPVGTIIVVTAIVGGVVLIGFGFAIFKCMRKKRGVSRLLDQPSQ